MNDAPCGARREPMSAWIVEKVHIDMLISAYNAMLKERRCGSGMLWGEDADRQGRWLWEMNHANHRHLYEHHYAADGEPEIPPYTFTECPMPSDFRTAIPPLLKVIACYEYQCCDQPIWENSSTAKWIEALRSALIGMLPGYDAAPWGVTERDAIVKAAAAHTK
jgi:hypothetical protein